MINPLQLSNVSIKGKTSTDGYSIRAPLHDVVLALATKNPTWQFVGIVRWDETVSSFDVFCEDQEIGELQQDYSGRSGGHCVRINSDKMQRIRTSDVKKAVREAQRGFVLKNESMLIEDSMRDIQDVMRHQRSRKHDKARDRLMKLSQPMQAYTMLHDREAFVNFLSSTDPKMVGLLDEYDTVKAEIQAMEVIEANPIAYIRVHKNKYIVKTIDNVQSYDDNTLPEEYRGKLGMLKLVEDEQCISGVGCRADANTFLITLV